MGKKKCQYSTNTSIYIIPNVLYSEFKRSNSPQMYLYEDKENRSSLLPISTTYCKRQVLSCLAASHHGQQWFVVHVIWLSLLYNEFYSAWRKKSCSWHSISKRIWITSNRENEISCWHNVVSKFWFSFRVVRKTTSYSTVYFGVRHFCSSFRI